MAIYIEDVGKEGQYSSSVERQVRKVDEQRMKEMEILKCFYKEAVATYSRAEYSSGCTKLVDNVDMLV
jgi:hypothetical protein